MKSIKSSKKSEDGGTVAHSKQNLGLKRSKPSNKTVTFDAYFVVLQKRDTSIRGHHKAPMAKYLSQFGNINAQLPQWFETHLKNYW